MRVIALPWETKAILGVRKKITILWSDIKAWTSGTAQAVLPQNAVGAATITSPANLIIGRVLVNVVTAFASSGGAITTLTLSVGDGGSATRFANAVDLKTAAWTLANSTAYLYTVADTVDGTATIVGQTMASLNAGQVDLYIADEDINPLALVGQP